MANNEFIARKGLIVQSLTTGTTESEILVVDSDGLVKARTSISLGGSSGTAGSSGSAGTAGTSGVSGASGTSGSAGSSGISGLGIFLPLSGGVMTGNFTAQTIYLSGVVTSTKSTAELNLADPYGPSGTWSITSDNGGYGATSAWVYGQPGNGSQLSYQNSATEAIGFGVYASGITNTIISTAKEIIIWDNTAGSNKNSGDMDKRAIFIGTRNSTFNVGVNNSVIIGGSGITASVSNTVYVPKINISGSISANTGSDTYNFVTSPSVANSPGAFGEIMTRGAGTTTAGDLYVFSAGTWVAADADATTTSTGLLGIALGTTPADGMLLRGFARSTSYTWADNKILYISSSVGSMTDTAPSTAGKTVRIVGYMVYALEDTIYFNPSNNWIEL